MFRMGQRTRRGMAVGALILSLSATTFGGSANAAPAADETKDCSTLAHARNDAVHTLHDAYMGFREQLKDLARDARELDRDEHHSKLARDTASELRSTLADARAKLQDIWTTAHAKIQDLADLGQACTDADEDKADADKADSDKAEADTDKAEAEKQDADKDDTDKDNDDKAVAKTTTTTNTTVNADLAAKAKDVVTQAVKDMQAVMDDVNAAVAKMTTAIQNADAAKADRPKTRDHRDETTSHHRDGKGSRG
jgi:DNA repair exonuclease SbcCD ATPase subunit